MLQKPIRIKMGWSEFLAQIFLSQQGAKNRTRYVRAIHTCNWQLYARRFLEHNIDNFSDTIG
jgi:hypothetical protein